MQHKYSLGNAPRMLALACALVLVNAAIILAQLSTGKIEGIVRDKDSGTPLSGAQVAIEGTRLGNVTNADGYYFILNVPPGRRNIEFTFTGYQKITVSSQLILAGQTTTINAVLSSTVVQLEGLVVEGQSEVLVPRDNTVTKQRITTEKLEQTPANRLEDLMVLEPGVQLGGSGSAIRGLRIRGGRQGEEGMVIDGVMVRNYTADLFAGGHWSGSAESGMLAQDATPLDMAIMSVEQVDIITGGFQAEFGNAQSGIVNIVTKEGGTRLGGNVRFTTDQQNPRTSDYGYNQLTTSLGGPVFMVPNLYFHVSGEIQGSADTDPTHADEGFRGVNQDFVDRLNAAVVEDPILSLPENAFSLEEFQRGRQFYASKTGKNASLFSPGNPVRLPGNWSDRTTLTGKLTWSPFQGLKLFASENWSRNQRSYPSGPNGDGNYFLTGIVDRYDPVINRQLPYREWGEDSLLYIPQSRGRRVRTSNLISGFDWNMFQRSSRSGSLQFRYSHLSTGEAPGSDLAQNFERETFMSWNPHDILFEVETYPNRDNPPDSQRKQYFPNGLTDMVQDWGYETPFATSYGNLYALNYLYLHERQNNFKVDLDMQVDRYNRFKTGVQINTFDNFKYQTNFNTHITENRSIDYSPLIMGLYAQHRIDLGDFVFDVGLRYDEFRPKSNWGLSPGDQFAERFFPKNVREFSPRFDVAFPVTDKSQLRFSYGTFKQLPGLSTVFSTSNFGDLEYSSTDAFEGGFSYLVSPDIVFDLVAYNRDMEGNVANALVFRDIWLYHTEMQSRGWVNTLANRSAGNIKGMDLTLKKRFSNDFALDLLYTLQFSRAQAGTPGGSYAGDDLRPNDGDQAHKLATILNYLFPADFKAGSLANRLLRETRVYSVFSLNSGQAGGSGNLRRSRWNYNFDLRGSRFFSLGARRRVNAFVEVFNVLNTKSLNAYPKGYKYEPNSHTTGGVEWKWDDMAQTDGSVRFNADFNQDGVLSLMESTKGAIANQFMLNTMDKRGWGRARQIRTGLELNF